jgi:hypothetical protein
MLNNSNIIHVNPSIVRGVFCLCVFFITHIAFAQPQLKISDAKKNFGFVKKGEVVEIKYEISNVGNEPLVINDAIVECSCTTVDFPKFPIMPLQKASITVKFDTKSVYDRQDRAIEIVSNSKINKQKIRFKGVVLK